MSQQQTEESRKKPFRKSEQAAKWTSLDHDVLIRTNISPIRAAIFNPKKMGKNAMCRDKVVLWSSPQEKLDKKLSVQLGKSQNKREEAGGGTAECKQLLGHPTASPVVAGRLEFCALQTVPLTQPLHSWVGLQLHLIG